MPQLCIHHQLQVNICRWWMQVPEATPPWLHNDNGVMVETTGLRCEGFKKDLEAPQLPGLAIMAATISATCGSADLDLLLIKWSPRPAISEAPRAIDSPIDI